MIGLRKRYRRWYPKAVAILEADWDRMVTFSGFRRGDGLRGSGKGSLEAILTT